MSLDKVAEARPSLEKFRNGHGGFTRGVKGRFSNMDLAILDDREGAKRGGGQVGGGPGAGEGEQVEGDVLLPTRLQSADHGRGINQRIWVKGGLDGTEAVLARRWRCHGSWSW